MNAHGHIGTIRERVDQNARELAELRAMPCKACAHSFNAHRLGRCIWPPYRPHPEKTCRCKGFVDPDEVLL